MVYKVNTSSWLWLTCVGSQVLVDIFSQSIVNPTECVIPDQSDLVFSRAEQQIGDLAAVDEDVEDFKQKGDLFIGVVMSSCFYIMGL